MDFEYKELRNTIGSVYGTNTNDGIHMYDLLQRDILSLRNTCIVLGGDWNAVWDRSPVDTNIDVNNMLNVPSTRRTDRIHALCDTLNLTDPYCTAPVVCSFLSTTAQLHATHIKGGRSRKRHSTSTRE